MPIRSALGRRAMLTQSIAAVLAAGRAATLPAQPPAPEADAPEADTPGPSTGLGLVVYDCGIRRTWLQQRDAAVDLFEPLNFLAHCRQTGAGGAQAAFGVLDAAAVREVRDYAQQHALYLEAIVAAPQDDHADLMRFDAEMRTAAELGALAARTTIMPGRRYEQFSTRAEFRSFAERGKQMLMRAVRIVERHGVPLAVENHKDQRNDERVRLLEQISSPLVGACVDTGNSLALLEDPIETVKAFAPWAKSVHLKDQAVAPYDEGFLLGDIPLGGGCLDLQRMVTILRQAQPQIRFSLELITRDALRVPCLTDAYWATMPAVPGRDLARTLRMVRQHHAPQLQQVSTLSLAERVALEDANVQASLQYARQQLKI